MPAVNFPSSPVLDPMSVDINAGWPLGYGEA